MANSPTKDDVLRIIAEALSVENPPSAYARVE